MSSKKWRNRSTGMMLYLTSYLAINYLQNSLCFWIENFLMGRSIKMVVEGFSSVTQSANAGVPQGCILSSTIFHTIRNDLFPLISNLFHTFVDNSTMQSSYSSPIPISVAEAASLANDLSKDIAVISKSDGGDSFYCRKYPIIYSSKQEMRDVHQLVSRIRSCSKVYCQSVGCHLETSGSPH